MQEPEITSLVNLTGEVTMALIMKPMGWAPKDRARWRLGTEDLSEGLFPPDKKLQELFETSCAEEVRGRVVVLDREKNHLIIETPAGLTPRDREEFTQAVWGEMYIL